MSDTDPRPAVAPADPMRPVKTATVIVYVTFFLLIVAIPHSLVNWARDMNVDVVRLPALRVAEAVQTLSQAMHADVPFRRARAAFLQWTGKDDN